MPVRTMYAQVTSAGHVLSTNYMPESFGLCLAVSDCSSNTRSARLLRSAR